MKNGIKRNWKCNKDETKNGIWRNRRRNWDETGNVPILFRLSSQFLLISLRVSSKNSISFASKIIPNSFQLSSESFTVSSIGSFPSFSQFLLIPFSVSSMTSYPYTLQFLPNYFPVSSKNSFTKCVTLTADTILIPFKFQGQFLLLISSLWIVIKKLITKWEKKSTIKVSPAVVFTIIIDRCL